MKKILFIVLTALLSTTAYANNCVIDFVLEKFDKAFIACNTEAEQGDSTAHFNLALLYDEGKGVEVNKEKALYWYTKAAIRGGGDAQYELARMYDKGDGAEVNKEEALFWYTKAADWDIAEAMYRLGIMYYEGDGVEKNIELARKYFEQAYEQKFKESRDIFFKE